MKLRLALMSGGMWFAGFGLVIAGALSFLYFAGLVAWQYVNQLQTGVWVRLPARLWLVDHATVEGPNVGSVLRFIPEFPVPWVMSPDSFLMLHKLALTLLNKLHAGVVFAVLGAGLVLLGARMMLVQRAFFAYERQQKRERLRRREEYLKVPDFPMSPDAPVPPIEQPNAAVFRTRARRASRA